MGVDVDEAGGDQQAVGIELAPAGAVHPAHLRDELTVDGHVGGPPRSARAVDHRSPADDQVVRRHGATVRPLAGHRPGGPT